MMTKFLVGSPSLSGVSSYFSTEVKTGIGIIALCLCVYFGIKQKIGAAIGTIAFAAFTWFMANDPEKILGSIGDLFSKIFGG